MVSLLINVSIIINGFIYCLCFLFILDDYTLYTSVASLSLNVSFHLYDFALTICFSLSWWLRSSNTFLSPILASLVEYVSFVRLGFDPPTCFISKCLASLPLNISFSFHGFARPTCFFHRYWLYSQLLFISRCLTSLYPASSLLASS